MVKGTLASNCINANTFPLPLYLLSMILEECVLKEFLFQQLFHLHTIIYASTQKTCVIKQSHTPVMCVSKGKSKLDTFCVNDRNV